MEVNHLNLPLSESDILPLRAGDAVELSGTVYTGRDAAHKRLTAALERGEALPIQLEGAGIYYVGPAPALPGQAVGAAGPTTSYRMDAYAPALIEHGLKFMIGKGDRSDKVIEAMFKYGCVYFAAIGGAAALLSKHIVSSKVIAYDDLGTEAIHEFELKDFPVFVAIDAYGNDLYREGPKRFLREQA